MNNLHRYKEFLVRFRSYRIHTGKYLHVHRFTLPEFFFLRRKKTIQFRQLILPVCNTLQKNSLVFDKQFSQSLLTTFNILQNNTLKIDNRVIRNKSFIHTLRKVTNPSHHHLFTQILQVIIPAIPLTIVRSRNFLKTSYKTLRIFSNNPIAVHAGHLINRWLEKPETLVVHHKNAGSESRHLREVYLFENYPDTMHTESRSIASLLLGAAGSFLKESFYNIQPIKYQKRSTVQHFRITLYNASAYKQNNIQNKDLYQYYKQSYQNSINHTIHKTVYNTRILGVPGPNPVFDYAMLRTLPPSAKNTHQKSESVSLAAFSTDTHMVHTSEHRQLFRESLAEIESKVTERILKETTVGIRKTISQEVQRRFSESSVYTKFLKQSLFSDLHDNMTFERERLGLR